jgi:16S rRNA (guanine527-N7)-methyltransferase
MLETARILELLLPFTGDAPLPAALASQLQTYLDLLLRWNSRINLTAVRDPEEIVTRHFGESLFAGRLLQESGALASTDPVRTLADIGSGPGFPGIPIKLLAPHIQVTLIESNHKKTAFLREVIRRLNLTGIEVFSTRAETLARQFSVITLRAVEKFSTVLPVAAGLVQSGGTLCLLIGGGQRPGSELDDQHWVDRNLYPIPLSDGRVVFTAQIYRP